MRRAHEMPLNAGLTRSRILHLKYADVWVASSSQSGKPHLVPLSFAWDGVRNILATERGSVTARNLEVARVARVGFGATRDVVMVDAELEHVVAVGDAPPSIGDRYAEQADWDRRPLGGELSYFLLRPQRVQAWREADEIAKRTLMRDGVWRT